jgi:pimeloyl-ACP methyl ester carboxylesterase
MATLRANDLEIGYDVTGDGPPMVMLHAATSTGQDTFGDQIPLLATMFRVHLPDARGHARSRWDVAQGFSTASLVDDVIAFVDTLGIETFHLVGYSMGAMTALCVAVRVPDRLRSLVVVGISAERDPRASAARWMLDPARIERDEPDWAADLARQHDQGQGAGAWRRLLPAVADDVASQPLLTSRELRTITAPTLVVCGDRDPFVPVAQAVALARAVRRGQLLVVPDGGHDVLDEGAATVNEALRHFYRQILGVEGTQ